MIQNNTKGKNKSGIILLILAVILLIGAVYFVTKKKTSDTSQSSFNINADSTQKLKTPSNAENLNENSLPNTASSNVNSNNNSSDEVIPPDKTSNETPDEALRQKIIAYVNQNLDKIAPPPKNDTWDTPSFYFVGNSKVYLELYGANTDLVGVEILFDVQKDGNSFKLNELARYKEGEEDWILSSGKDDYSDYAQDDYEYNEQTKKWEKLDDMGAQDSSNGQGTDSNSNGNSILP